MPEDCRAVSEVLARVGDKWTVPVVSLLGDGSKPFNELRRGLGSISQRMVRALLAGSQSNALTPSRLLRLSKNLPHDWKEQRCFLGFAA